MKLNWMTAGAVLGFLAVGLGAFGAHALKARVGTDLLAVFETGVRYQMYHALALILVGVVDRQQPGRRWNLCGGFFLAGVTLFSGSLYLMTLAGARWLGAVTPLGGVCLLAGWLAFAIASSQRTRS